MRTLPKKMMQAQGFTLLELMAATSALMVLLAMLYGSAITMTQAVRMEDSAVTLNSEARMAMEIITRNLRQSQSTGLTTTAGGVTAALGGGAVTNIGFSRVADVDGNGTALSAGMVLETVGPFRFAVDTADANSDGLTTTQLVRLDAANNVVEVLANNISPVVVTGDFYDTPQGGIVFQNVGGSIQVTLILRQRADVNLPMMVVRLDEIVTPRN